MPTQFFDADFKHPHGPESNWQESVLLFFHDAVTGMSGYFRIGNEPNDGTCQEWIYLQSGEGARFRRLRFGLPLAVRGKDNFNAGGLDWTCEKDGTVHLTADYPEAQVDLRYTDFYPSTPCWQWTGTDKKIDIGAAAHFESSGQLSGTVTIGGKTCVIKQAFAHRDHSWGTRDGDNMRVCRWCVGTTGPELSHSLISFLDRHGRLALGGWVVRNGVVDHARDIDIVVHNNIDGLTCRGAQVGMRLETGEDLLIEVDVISSFITGHNSDHGGPHSYVCAEGVSKTRIGDRRGVCCLTVCNSLAGVGEAIPSILETFSTISDGLSQRPASRLLLAC